MKNNHNIFIYSNFNFSESNAGSTRMQYYAKALASKEQKVYLITCTSNKFSDDDFVEIEPNVFILANKKPTTRFFKTINFLIRLNKFAVSKSYNKTFIYYPFPLVFLEITALLYLKGFKNQSIYCELNEIPKYTSSFHAPIKITKIKYSLKKILFKSVFTLMEPSLKFYDGLICISTSIEKYGQKYNKNTLRIPILTNPDIPILKSNEEYFTKGKFNIGFSGSIHPSKEDLESFIGVISKIHEKGIPITFNLCGGIFKDYQDEFLEKCNSRTELNYYGYLNNIELSTFLSQQDLLVVPRGFSLQNKYGFSTKLSDYLNHKKLILVTDISDNKLYIKDNLNGFIVPPDNPVLMFEKLLYIIENYSELNKIIIPKTIEISKNSFNYKLFSSPLRTFLEVKSKQ